MKGYFLALEGPDGSGKSTIGKMIQETLIKDGFACKLTREPGGTKIGEAIREILLSNDNLEMSDRTEALLYAASRSQHVNEVIIPYIKSGGIIISDRYVYSSLAYQGYSRSLGIGRVMDINQFAMDGCMPDRILFFDMDPKRALNRKFDNRDGDRLEVEGDLFHQRVYQGYKKAIELYPEKVAIVDATRTIEEVYSQCMKIIKEDLDEISDSNSPR